MKFCEVVTSEGRFSIIRNRNFHHQGLEILARDRRGGNIRHALPPEGDDFWGPVRLPGKEVEISVRPASILRWALEGTAREMVELRETPFRLLIIGSGRCGTTTLARYLDGMTFGDGQTVVARHESLAHVQLDSLISRDFGRFASVVCGQKHNVESGAFYALAPNALRADTIVHLIRDGRRVVQSGLARGWYQNDSPWNLIKPDFEGSVFEKCCQLWDYTCNNCDRVADRVYRLEDLCGDEARRRDFQDSLGLVPGDRPFPHANQGAAPSSWTDWTKEQMEQFTRICGRVMDRHYPGWESTW